MDNSEFETHRRSQAYPWGLKRNVSLKEHTTMRTGGCAKYFAKACSRNDVRNAYTWAATHGISVCTIGSGSNIICTDGGYEGLILKNSIWGFRVANENEGILKISLGAGEMLDEVVRRTADMGLSGIECLSLIPGTCGGAIMQNSGAYGQEISDVLQSVDVYDVRRNDFIVLGRDACRMGYRTSIFKNGEPGRYVILGLQVRLRRGLTERPSYPSLSAVLGSDGPLSPGNVRSAVIRIRRSKLPDPAIIPNCGSFFVNPVLLYQELCPALREAEPPLQKVRDGWCKIPAAWLIEQCGLKNHFDENLSFGTWKDQPLVIFGTGEGCCENLMKYSSLIVQTVRSKYGITLKREPVLMGT